MVAASTLLNKMSRAWSSAWSKAWHKLAAFVGQARPRADDRSEKSQLEAWLRFGQASGLGNLIRFLEVFEEQYGHARSAREGKAVDRDGLPLPWYTYPAIEFLNQLDLRDKVVFEYGAGNSSLYYAGRARRVLCVDNDAAWVRELTQVRPANLEVLFCSADEDYLSAVKRIDRPDIIVVDGSYRRRCAQQALAHLAPDGILILDNADWFPKTAADLRHANLIQVDFTGFGPVNYYPWTTSFFFRPAVRLVPRLDRQPSPGIGSLRHDADDDANVPASAA